MDTRGGRPPVETGADEVEQAAKAVRKAVARGAKAVERTGAATAGTLERGTSRAAGAVAQPVTRTAKRVETAARKRSAASRTKRSAANKQKAGTKRKTSTATSIAVIALVAGVLVGCGDDGGSGSSVSGPEAAVRETIIIWLLEGDCDVMTDDFLKEQVLIGDDNTRAENCELFGDLFIEKQYDADDVKITDVEITGSEATAVVGDDFSNVESTYTLVKEDGRWRIDAAELT